MQWMIRISNIRMSWSSEWMIRMPHSLIRPGEWANFWRRALKYAILKQNPLQNGWKRHFNIWNLLISQQFLNGFCFTMVYCKAHIMLSDYTFENIRIFEWPSEWMRKIRIFKICSFVAFPTAGPVVRSIFIPIPVLVPKNSLYWSIHSCDRQNACM